MITDPAVFISSLIQKLAEFDTKAAGLLCQELVVDLFRSNDAFPVEKAERILQELRNKRLFEWMEKVADALIQTGRQSLKVRRQYAQSLVDQGSFTAALAILNQLISELENISDGNQAGSGEKMEARGLAGRIYKQLYINADNPGNPKNVEFLRQSVQYYLTVYIAAPEVYLWQGINAVALIWRAAQDGIDLPAFPDYRKMADSILKVILSRESEKNLQFWDPAIAAEACTALKRENEALQWIGKYVNDERADAFEIASTLRQFTEVWKLGMNTALGKQLLPVLRAALLKREGGNVTMETVDLINEQAQSKRTSFVLEKVFGDDTFKTYKWYMLGASRCLSVARIGRDSSKGFGTGFLLKGSVLHPAFGNDPVLVTNAHVVSDDLSVTDVLRSGDAVITFEALDRDKEFSAAKILWSSPPSKLDVTIIQFGKPDIPRIKKMIKSTEFFPLAKSLPPIDDTERIYVIGHPFGGTLQLSLQDNMLLDEKDPRIHYRTPTVGGSSGSPVFNQQWELIGIHHAGDQEMPRLHGKGTYPANEGITIDAIKKALSSAF